MDTRLLALRDAFLASRVHGDMRAHLEGGSLPDSDAKRHHFIPRLLLRGFALRADANRIVQLDLRVGDAPRPVRINQAASRNQLYTVVLEDGVRHRRVEAWLSAIEGRAADALTRLVADAWRIGRDDAVTISYFVAMLLFRTPAATLATAAFADQAMRIRLAIRLAQAPPAEDAAERAARERALDGLRDGSVAFPDERFLGLRTGFDAVGTTAQHVFQCRWTLLRDPERRFVTSDRGVAMFDPAPTHPWTGSSLASSPYAQTTVPLRADACLLLEPVEPWAGRAEAEAPPAQVRELNLRVCGWADRHLFAAGQEELADVRRDAKARPRRIRRPRPARHVVTFPALPDQRFARANRRRGWPERVELSGVVHDYVVLDPGENPVDRVMSIVQHVRHGTGRAHEVRCTSADRVFRAG